MDNPILIFVLIFIIFLGILLFWLRSKKQKLSKKLAQKYIQKIKNTQNQSPIHSLIESHKIFIAAIGELGKKSKKTASEKINSIKKNLPNEKKIWYFHRLRNQAAHEVDFNISKTKVQEAREQFIRALKALT